MGFAHGAQQPDGNHVEDVPLPGGQGGKVSTGDLRRGNDGVVVGHFAAVYHLGGVYREGLAHHEGQRTGHGGAESGQALRHILGQIAAVRSGVGCQPLFVEGLEVVKGLLGGVVKKAVGLPLKGGQVVELRWPLSLVLPGDGLDHGGLAQAGGAQLFRVRLGIEFAAGGPDALCVQLHGVKFFLLEMLNRRFPFRQQRECGGQHPAHVQRLTFI